MRWAAKRSAFYREAFRARGIDARRVRSPADLGDFFTTPDDLSRDPEKFLCAPPSFVFESSGTSGRNKQVYFDNREMDYIGKVRSFGDGPDGDCARRSRGQRFRFLDLDPRHVVPSGFDSMPARFARFSAKSIRLKSTGG